MEYREIVSVTGLGGLYQLVGSKKDGAIVRSLADNTTKFIPARLHNVTPLESIEIYTTGDNVRLHHVLQQMKDSSTARPDAKKASNDEIKSYFKEVYPDMDEDRVYASDMKKMLKWYDLLQGADLLNFEALQEQEEAPAEDAQAEETTTKESVAVTEEFEKIADEAVAETPAPKKSRAKKSADEDAAAEGEEKPKKTARKKKTDEEGEGGEGATEKPAKKAAAKKKKEEGE